MVQRLLGRVELKVNAVDRQRQTALFHAASAGQQEVVRLLLADLRTNAAISNRPAHLTAGDMALALGFEKIAELVARSGRGVDDISPPVP